VNKALKSTFKRTPLEALFSVQLLGDLSTYCTHVFNYKWKFCLPTNQELIPGGMSCHSTNQPKTHSRRNEILLEYYYILQMEKYSRSFDSQIDGHHVNKTPGTIPGTTTNYLLHHNVSWNQAKVTVLDELRNSADLVKRLQDEFPLPAKLGQPSTNNRFIMWHHFYSSINLPHPRKDSTGWMLVI